MLTPPQNLRVIKFPSSEVWFDEEGILYSLSNKMSQRTLQETIDMIEEFKKITGGRRFCMLVDVTHAAPQSREVREYAAKELPKIVTAMAMISTSPLGRMVANLFFALKPAPYPARIFTTVEEGREWLRQYL